jgi:PAS domain S-box-containing protein
MLLAAVLSTGLLGTLWIHSEYITFRTESGAIREKFFTSYKEFLKTEVNKASSYIEYQKERVEPRLKESIQDRVNEAHSIALNIFNQYRGKRTLIEMQEMVKEALRSIRFNKGRGYYFAFNLRGIEELFADRPEMEGKDMLSVRGAKGEYVVKDMLDLVRRDKEGFYEYTWTKPNRKGHFPKIAYVKLFEPFGWVIGTGEYLDDVESDIQKEVIGFIEQIRYKEDGYIFVGQWDGVSLTIPAKGQNMWNVTDSNGKKIVQELIRLAKEGSGYFEYVMPKLQDKRPAAKLSYVVGVPEWKWYVGAGIYVDEIETVIEQRKKEFERQIINHLAKIALVLVGLVLFVLFVALIVFRKAKKNFDSFSSFFERATIELNEINPDIMDFIELKDLADSANDMVKARKQAEKALRESEERFAAIFNTQLNGIIIIDPETQTIVDANTAALDMIGATREDVIGHICHKFICPAEKGMCPITDLGIDVDNSERVLIRTDRTELPILKSVSQLKLGNKNFLIESFIDITDRKRADEEKRQLGERLQRSEKMEAIGTLAGGVAHDLNNVLGIVVGYAEMLLDEIDESSPLRDDVMKIMEGGQRSAAIVQDLLTLARRGVQTRKVFNLNAVITECQKTPEFEKVLSFNPKVQIKTELEADLLNIMGSPMHLAKTILNLVTNAMEAMPGDGALTISTSNQSLDKPIHGYDAVKEGDYIVLSITDTGEGISDSNIKYIFEPFYTKKVMGRSGTGLGLAVVWGTVKDHNGYINVHSEVGKGTTFTLYFPVAREEIAKEATIPLSDYIGQDESILVIDDIKEQRELAAKMLGKLNYRVKTVSSGEEAVEFLRIKKVDLIVLDMIMDPGMDGLDTYKAIVEIYPQQKAIIVSGFSETERVRHARSLGVGDYLRKPYVIEKLGLAVRKELDRKQ